MVGKQLCWVRDISCLANLSDVIVLQIRERSYH